MSEIRMLAVLVMQPTVKHNSPFLSQNFSVYNAINFYIKKNVIRKTIIFTTQLVQIWRKS